MKKIIKDKKPLKEKLNKTNLFSSEFNISDKVSIMGLKGTILAVRFAKNSINYDVIIDNIPMYNVHSKAVKKLD